MEKKKINLNELGQGLSKIICVPAFHVQHYSRELYYKLISQDGVLCDDTYIYINTSLEEKLLNMLDEYNKYKMNSHNTHRAISILEAVFYCYSDPLEVDLDEDIVNAEMCVNMIIKKLSYEDSDLNTIILDTFKKKQVNNFIHILLTYQAKIFIRDYIKKLNGILENDNLF